jgi:hypothetical protein
MYIVSVAHSINILYKKTYKFFPMVIVGLFIAVSLVPASQANSISELTDKLNFSINKTDKSFVDCFLIVIGKISNPRIEEQGKNKYLIFYAEVVFVSGFYSSYDGNYDVTQWIYNENIKLSWKTSGPDFRGIVTKDVIFGIQRPRFIGNHL